MASLSCLDSVNSMQITFGCTGSVNKSWLPKTSFTIVWQWQRKCVVVSFSSSSLRVLQKPYMYVYLFIFSNNKIIIFAVISTNESFLQAVQQVLKFRLSRMKNQTSFRKLRCTTWNLTDKVEVNRIICMCLAYTYCPRNHRCRIILALQFTYFILKSGILQAWGLFVWRNICEYSKTDFKLLQNTLTARNKC